MEQEFIEQARRRLEEDRDRLLQQLGVTVEEFDRVMQTAEDTAQDFGDIGQMKADGEKLAQIGMEERRRLRRIRSALTRIRQGIYGTCLSCGGQIPRGRLEALPEAPLCLECEQRLEAG